MIAIWRPTSLKSACCATAEQGKIASAAEQAAFRNQEIVMNLKRILGWNVSKVATVFPNVDFEYPENSQFPDFLRSSQRLK
jgi:hypothetical protein